MNLIKFFITFVLLGVFNFSFLFGSQLIGKQAPLFVAQAVFPSRDSNSKSKYIAGEFDLKEYIGKYKIVLYFYPMDNTPGCTKEAQNFRDDIELLKKQGIIVVGVSCDSVQSHMKFQHKYALPFILVHDSRWNRAISKKYNAAGFFYSKRKTYLIDKKGFVIHAFEQVDIQNQVDDILRIFKDNNGV